MTVPGPGPTPPASLFHVARTGLRELIAGAGLRAPCLTGQEANWTNEGESDGVSVYLLETLEEAHDWAEYMYMRFFRRGWTSFDVWAVSAAGLELAPDPCMPPGYHSFRCLDPLECERLALVATVAFDERGLPLDASRPLVSA